MIRNQFPLVCLVVVAFTASAERAGAQTFQLAWYDATGTNPISTINVAPSSSFTARVYMTQVSGSPNDYLETIGMFGFSVTVDAGTATSPVSIASTANIVRNSQFDDASAGGIQLGTNTASFSATVSNPAAPVLSPVGQNRILLGTLTFQSGPIGTQTLVASDGPLGNLGGPPNFDPMTVGTGALGVTVVPEPATVLLLAAGGLGLCRVIIRRRKTADAVPSLAV